MLKIERHKLIEEELHTYGSILISTMSQKLDCSEETIRRDLKELEAQNKLKRIHGGAFLPDADDKGAPVQLRETFFSEEKKKLASYAIDNFIKNSDTIFLDCSTTCLALAKEIVQRNLSVTIITNSLRIFDLFSNQFSKVKLIALGGTFRQRSNSFSGYQTTDAISYYLADKCFISNPAVDLDHGLLDNNMNESQVRKAYISQSREHYLIADHTKFFDSADYIITGLGSINMIITDKCLPDIWNEKLRQHNIPVRYC
ncbi:MAG: DeoR/GlpR transcriptional regulator [Dorea sp.]|jgi:DeoR/GlpR family transcriptional regulator of sugar metabolism|nr:DeoR/GlpR transcriptional regulator [Dorea sp.]MCI9454591.1 DeoR/GlpR transcriptional regulator [Dorea sp.]